MSGVDEIALEDLLMALQHSPGNDMALRLLINKIGENCEIGKAEASRIIEEVLSQLKLCAGSCEVEHLCCIILSNLTINEDNCSVLLENDFEYLIEKFLAHNPQKKISLWTIRKTRWLPKPTHGRMWEALYAMYADLQRVAR